MTKLSKKCKNLPEAPGVYLMKDQKGVIIYVGKAKNIKNRVSSYFRSEVHSTKTRTLISHIDDFEIIITKTEVEALLLERTLIKHHSPRYNILLRDDKEYPIIRIDYEEDWPRIRKVRRLKNDGATYIGPFGQASILSENLKTVFRIFPIVRCSPYEFKTAKRPCNYYHMNLCQAPCTKNLDRNQYIQIVKHAEKLLRGQNKELRRQLEIEMNQASDREEYERAAKIRDQIHALKVIGQTQVAVTFNIEEADVINFYLSGGIFVFHIIFVRNYQIIGNDHYISEEGIGSNEESLSSFLMQYYELRHPASLLLTPLIPSGSSSILEVLNGNKATTSTLRLPKNKEEQQLMELSVKNARQLHSELGHADHHRKVSIEDLKEVLCLTELPLKIECIDISNLGSSEIVASIVTFYEGKPQKNLYRKYKIQSVYQGPDDFSSIFEVMSRRLDRGETEEDLPDLMVIDGGKGQLSSALKALNQSKSTLNIISLAKSKTRGTIKTEERVFLPGRNLPIILSPGSPTFRLLTQIRDEAHRFAISYHRKRRSKAFLSSPLDDISGVGPTIKKRLLSHFGDLPNIATASINELVKVPGISETLARKILQQLTK